MNKDISILVAEDDPLVANLITKQLTQEGYNPIIVEDGELCLKEIGENAENYDLVICDLSMPKMDGEGVYNSIRSSGNKIPIILTSGSLYQNISQDAYYLQKPFTKKELIDTITNAIEEQGL